MSSKRSLPPLEDGDQESPGPSLRRSTRQRQNNNTHSNSNNMDDLSQEAVSLVPPTRARAPRKPPQPKAAKSAPLQLVSLTAQRSDAPVLPPASTSVASKKQPTKGVGGPKYHPIPVPAHLFHCKMVATPHGEFGTIAELFQALNPYPLTETNLASFTQKGKELTCGSCLQPYQVGDSVVVAPCLHRFHLDCIVDWFQFNHEKQLKVALDAIAQLIPPYMTQLHQFNSQFQPRPDFSLNAQGQMGVFRSPTNEEIALFSPPPSPLLLEHPQRVECDVYCPWCSCDWKQLLRQQYGDMDSDDMDFSRFN